MKINGLCVVGTIECVSAVLYLTPFDGVFEYVYMQCTCHCKHREWVVLCR